MTRFPDTVTIPLLFVVACATDVRTFFVANHRAGKRDASQVDSAETPRLATPRTTTPGKRKAVKPSKRPRIDATDAVAARRNTRAAGRKKLFPVLPSAPTLVGAAALVVAATGAVTIGEEATPAEASGGVQKLSAQASVLTGTSRVESSDVAVSRERAVSRDSQREALEDAAEQKLQAAAEAQAEERNAALAALAASAEKHADEIAANAWVLPISPGAYRLSARFGESSGLWSSTHTGLDFAAPSGTPILSVANGVVTSTEYDGAYGNKTVITLEDGTEIWYCHQTSFQVSPGDTVRGGQVIGTVGSTGNSTGPHLHLEVRPGAGDAVDPYAALVARGLTP
jgi:murein DD-endopeptidase MepM/ murein hydrolase activator NlpD